MKIYKNVSVSITLIALVNKGILTSSPISEVKGANYWAMQGLQSHVGLSKQKDRRKCVFSNRVLTIC